MTEPSRSHLVLIPTYNSGARVLQTVREAMLAWSPVWVVVDGSTDGTSDALQDLARHEASLRVLVLPRNQGKGAAVLHGLEAAATQGFSHALVMDADGQHPAACIASFMAESARHPAAMVLGVPVFDTDAPQLRVQGRKLSNQLVRLETPGTLIEDSLYGFRIYPIRPLIAVMRATGWMRRFDFDPEAAVRLAWAGVPARNLPAPVRYLRSEDGGVSHFHYGRDNLLLTWMHLRLLGGALLRLPERLRARRSEGRTP